MSSSHRIEGERVFCHQCDNEWDRAHGGLTCPRCEGEFTEILQPNTTTNEAATPPPIPRHPSERNPLSSLADHNPWADVPDPDEADISSYEFTMPGGGRGTFSFTSYSTTRNGPMPGNMNMPGMFFMGNGRTTGGFGSFDTFGTGRGNDFPRAGQPPGLGPQPRDMQDLFSMVFQTMNGGAFQQIRRPGERVQPGGPPNPFDLLSAILNPANSRHGDTVWSQEAFDRILEQLAEQNSMSTAPGPASENAIKNLPSRKVDQEMLGSDGKAECSICMDNVEVGTDVTTLPCNHWFHRDCVVAWLKEHDTCPHCRKAITDPEERQAQPQSSRRRSGRRSSSVASPYGTGVPPGAVGQPPDSPSALREQRQFYYGSRRDAEERPDRPRRHSSNQGRSRGGADGNNRDNSGSGSSGGVTGWVRNRLGL
jgi:E3 ubiquitin-protein ligase RNF115/126